MIDHDRPFKGSGHSLDDHDRPFEGSDQFWMIMSHLLGEVISHCFDDHDRPFEGSDQAMFG